MSKQERESVLCECVCALLQQVVFSNSRRELAQTVSHSYKVFMKAEDARARKKSDVWTAPAAAEPTSRES